MAKSFSYTYLDLKDAGEVLVVGFKQASILDQRIIDQIGREFEQAGLEASGNRKLLLNFQGVEFMSSAMLGKLITLFKKLQARSGRLILCNISPEIQEVFKITKLDKLFTILDDEQVALQSF